MEWLNSLWGSAPSSSGSNSNLQVSGHVSKEALLEFFAKGKELFESSDFKSHLRLGHEQGKDVQVLVNQAQASAFESIGINGSFGLSYLARVRVEYANDAEMLRMFYEFVHLEERALDEAEMPEAAFKGKYETLEAVKREMQEREAELQALSPEERNKAVAAIFQKIALGGSKPCCNHQGSCSHGGSSLPPPPMEPGQGGATMSEEEQLRFFQSLSKD